MKMWLEQFQPCLILNFLFPLKELRFERKKVLKNQTGFTVTILTYNIHITVFSKLSTFVTSNHVKVKVK